MKNKFSCLIHVVFPVLSQMSCFSSGQIFWVPITSWLFSIKKCGLIFLKLQKCLGPTSKLKALRQPHMIFQMHEKMEFHFWQKLTPKNTSWSKVRPTRWNEHALEFRFLMIIDALTLKIQFYASLRRIKGSSSLTMQLTPCFVSFEVQIIGVVFPQAYPG